MKRNKPGSGTDYLQFMHDRHHAAIIQKHSKSTNKMQTIYEISMADPSLRKSVGVAGRDKSPGATDGLKPSARESELPVRVAAKISSARGLASKELARGATL